MTDRAIVERSAERWRRWTTGCLTASASTLPFSHVPAQIALALAFAGWAAWSFTSGRIQAQRDPFLWAGMAYWGWNLLASASSVRPMHSLVALADNEWPALLGLLIWWSFGSLREVERLLKYYLTASGVSFGYGIVQTLTGVDWIKGVPLHQAGEGAFRAVGFSGFYLTFAGFAMSVFFLAVAFAMVKPASRTRWIVPVLAVGAILGTYARSVWLAMALLVPLGALASTYGRKRRWAMALAATAVAVVMAVEPLRDRAVSVFDLSQHETRLNLWKTSLAIAQAHPVLGIGQDNFTTFFNKFRVPGFYDTAVHPHNDYLSTLVHGGIPALSAFLAMWAILMCKGWNVWSRERAGFGPWVALGATTAVAGFQLSSLFQNYYGTFVNCFNWWLISGLILSTYRLSVKMNTTATDSITG
jgi:O-antigen ligase